MKLDISLPMIELVRSGRPYVLRNEAEQGAQGMKHFTPELFTAFNSSDREIARDASTRWDKAVAAYDKHLRSLHRRLPPPVRQLTKLSLHDAELIEFEEVSPNGPAAWRPAKLTCSVTATRSSRNAWMPASSRPWKVRRRG